MYLPIVNQVAFLGNISWLLYKEIPPGEGFACIGEIVHWITSASVHGTWYPVERGMDVALGTNIVATRGNASCVSCRGASLTGTVFSCSCSLIYRASQLVRGRVSTSVLLVFFWVVSYSSIVIQMFTSTLSRGVIYHNNAGVVWGPCCGPVCEFPCWCRAVWLSICMPRIL